MNWILFGMIFILAQQKTWYKLLIGDYYVSATPLPQVGSNVIINPYIRHWEAAKYDRKILETAQQYHQMLNQRRREKRELNTNYGPGNIIKLNFFAHDREFRLLLREDPSSIFSSDIKIENTQGPVDYDVSRVYTGVIEDDDNSHVHGILTSDNLFDGTISTKHEQYYIEPSLRYSKNLHNNGIHSIVYKLSDVKMHHPINLNEHNNFDEFNNKLKNNNNNNNNNNEHYCASEKFHRKLKNDFKNKRKKIIKSDNKDNNINSDSKMTFNKRRKRWLPEEMTESQNIPLPLDLDVPYNDDFSTLSRNNNNNNNNFQSDDGNININQQSKQEQNRKNILVNSYNPNSDFNLRNTFTNRNIIINSFDNNIKNNINNNNININMSRPSHKTHVEIITKNGATKKPNIIFNNYDPDVILTNSNYNNNYNHNNNNNNHHNHNNINLNVRNDINDNNPRNAYERKSTCMLYLQADHTFFQKMGSDEASIEAITRHVQRANTIYKNTDFNGDGKPDNITFMIKRIKVHNLNALKDPTYRFPGNYGVEKFLELFSEEDYDAFCLAYMFTYRDFEMGTLGLAWTGDLKNAGGVCEKNGHYRGSLKSLNTGIVTLLNYGKHVPPAVSHVTLAHEIGHNFGSPHDPEQCTPGGEDGNFIMFARATSGDKRNNNKFSPCSLKAIEPVLNAKARSAKGCFTERQLSICGNGVVEPGEQCDCGWEEDCKDSCCYPMSRHPSIDEKPCTLTPRASCSPSQGPCCTMECALKLGDKCRDDNGCRDDSYCDGHMAQCPPSVNKPNKTICNKEFVCYMGDCTGSICLAYGLESCQCIPGPNDLKTKACELCCKIPGENNLCKSSFEWNEQPYDVPDMFAKPGTPCNDYNGYCDVFQKCREVDPSGPLATLRKLLLSEESIASFKKWIQSNWYTVALVIIAVIALLILSAKLLGKRSNLKLKSVTIIHSATTETVRLPDDNNGVIVHTAIRSKVPLKKKVRGERKMKTPKETNHSNNIAAIANKVAKRQGNSSDSPKKVTKKKKRVSAPVVAEEQNKGISDPAPIKMKKQKKTKVKHNNNNKEVIDYSSRTENHTNTFGKVQKWLLESPIVSQTSSQIEHTSKITNIMSKSQSTPERLTQRSPKKTKSVGNLNEKVKLQVVYKPPFKFSLKLSKNNGTIKTHVIGGGGGINNKSKRGKIRGLDKKRVGIISTTNATATSSPSTTINLLGVSPSSDDTRTRRTALLIRTITTTDDNDLMENNIINSEPNYETLNSRKDGPVYENVHHKTYNGSDKISPTNTISTVNTATFRINKSASGSNIVNNNINNKTQLVSLRNTTNNTKLSSRGSVNNINQMVQQQQQQQQQHHQQLQHQRSNNSINNSNTNLTKQFGSTQNLMRSSTTNLSTANNKTATNRDINFDNLIKRGSKDLNRSSTTNLNKISTTSAAAAGGTTNNSNNRMQKYGGSNTNINKRRESFDCNFDEIKIRSRKNSMTNMKTIDSSSKNSIPRLSSNNINNTNKLSTSLKRGSISNIPRASLKSNTINLMRQTSLQAAKTKTTLTPTISTGMSGTPIINRPYTSGCENNKNPFEWPNNVLNKDKDEPLPSDLEVFVSDIENLVNDDE